MLRVKALGLSPLPGLSHGKQHTCPTELAFLFFKHWLLWSTLPSMPYAPGTSLSPFLPLKWNRLLFESYSLFQRPENLLIFIAEMCIFNCHLTIIGSQTLNLKVIFGVITSTNLFIYG